MKLNILLPYIPAITLLDIYPKELNTSFYIKTCTQMFIAALSIHILAHNQVPKPGSNQDVIHQMNG